MHIISQLSSMLNINPSDKPSLPLEFYPLPFSKYITIYNEQAIQSNFYDYFDDVIFEIRDYLIKNKIEVIQFINSPNDKKISGCYPIEKFSYSQMNYLIKNSLLNISTDNYTNEICGILSVPSISLVGNRFKNNSYPWYGDKSKNFVLSNLNNKKPSFSIIENPKAINNIKTEEISELILDVLNIKIEKKYETLFVGEKYHINYACDIIPNFKILDPTLSNFECTIRFDKYKNESNCLDFCSNINHIICVDSKISEQFLNIIKNKCTKIIFMVDKNSKISDLDFYVRNGFKYEIFYKNNILDKDIALKFLDYGIVNLKHSFNIDDNFKNIHKDKFFKSSKFIYSNNKKYLSYAHLEKNIEIGIINKCIDSKSFWLDIERYKIFGEK